MKLGKTVYCAIFNPMDGYDIDGVFTNEEACWQYIEDCMLTPAEELERGEDYDIQVTKLYE
jgi:hypothetical protein